MTDTLYDHDLYAWAREQAEALRVGRLDALDLAHLAEELDDLGNSRRDALRSALKRIVEHFLKLEHSPAWPPRAGWVASVIEHRQRAADLLEDNPSLRRDLPAMLDRAWRGARALAAHSLKAYDHLNPAILPKDCPYTLEQVLDESWWPVNRHGLE